MEDRDLTDAGGGFVTAVPGPVAIDSAISFDLIRGGHIDMTVLGGLEVDERGQPANWTNPGKLIPGIGGSNGSGHECRQSDCRNAPINSGKSKIVSKYSLPLTYKRRVDLIVTDLAVLRPEDECFELIEYAPDVSDEHMQSVTEADPVTSAALEEMTISNR